MLRHSKSPSLRNPADNVLWTGWVIKFNRNDGRFAAADRKNLMKMVILEQLLYWRTIVERTLWSDVA